MSNATKADVPCRVRRISDALTAELPAPGELSREQEDGLNGLADKLIAAGLTWVEAMAIVAHVRNCSVRGIVLECAARYNSGDQQVC